MRRASKSPRNRQSEVIGWRESVGLPELGISVVRAKIDTGARTSALHAIDEEMFERDGVRWVSFAVPGPGRLKSKRAEAPLLDERNVKNTSGVAEWRRVIRTVLLIGQHQWHIDLSLADRANMEFDLILGRTAFHARNICVDPDHSYLLGPPKRFESKVFSQSLLATTELNHQGEEE